MLALSTLALTSCGDDDDDGDAASPSGSASEAPADEGDGDGSGETLSVTAKDYEFEGIGKTLEGGVVTVEFTNEGEQPHELGFAKLAEELDPEGFGELLGPVFEGAPFPEDFQGHTGITETAPGETFTSTFTLEEGNYAVYCAISDESESESEEEGGAGEEAEEAPPHFLLGMYQTLTVEGDNGASLPDEATITATDYTFDVPELEAGEQELTFLNEGPKQWHHIVLLGWPEGVDEAAAKEAFAAAMEAEDGEPPEGTPEAEDEFGSQVFSPGGGGTFPVELKSGRTYTAACFIHDLTGGPPHAVAHDMVVHFTVK